jgi:hypothetical protein
MIKIKDDLEEINITITDRDFYNTLVYAAKYLADRYSTRDIKNVVMPNKREITFTKATNIRGALAEFGDEFE